MNSKYSQVPLHYLVPFFSQWHKHHTSQEVGNVFFLPGGESLFRALQYKDWIKETYNKTACIVNAETELVINPESLEEKLHAVDLDTPVVLVAKRLFLNPDAHFLASAIETWYAKGRGIVILHQGMPSEMQQFVSLPCMYQASHQMKIYPHKVALEYIENVSKIWNIQLDSEIKEEICRFCGGIPWLINDCLRTAARFAQGNVSLFETDSFIWKTDQLIGGLPKDHKSALITRDRNKYFKPSIELTEFGLISPRAEPLPFIAKWITRFQSSNLHINSNHILLDNQDLSHLFSRSEINVLHQMFLAKNQIHSRDKVAGWFWGVDWQEQFSDWALDQMISRLRRKLLQHHLPLKIVTKKGSGYVLN